ncbi:MAG: hypothetical protein O7C75_07185, partial [Verrucomicrobia bacterium]|nr:hypothetical protein [Verrucomicrobiota bacterium]
MSRLWAITSYFNPAGFKRRLANYRTFHEQLGVPLATVELSFGGEFAFDNSDADIILKLRGDDVMWQKERLLNLVIDRLPEECDRVAWIDCDVIFESKDWVSHAINALDHSALVHLYEHRVNLPKDTAPEDLYSENSSKFSDLQTPSAIYLMSRSKATDDDFRRAGVPVGLRSTVGLAWASSRKILKRHGLYDACIMGGADRAIIGAALGRFDLGIEALKMTGARMEHYLSWARRFHDAVKCRVGHIPGRAFHLWHGELQDRQYESRLDVLNQHSFDPFVDISVDSQGLWRWASNKPR